MTVAELEAKLREIKNKNLEIELVIEAHNLCCGLSSVNELIKPYSKKKYVELS